MNKDSDRDFGGIVAEKEQQYRQNRDVFLMLLPRAGTLGFAISPCQGWGI
ncbi:hypothetical protein [Cyclobacterium amurskyense]|nr:hypothetical protein [Cyclobacterium amurskyense]